MFRHLHDFSRINLENQLRYSRERALQSLARFGIEDAEPANLVERLGLVEAGLADVRVHDVDHVVRRDDVRDLHAFALRLFPRRLRSLWTKCKLLSRTRCTT